jgi:hypothetical protein
MHSHRRKMITKMTDTPETDGEWNRIACYDHPQFEQGIAEFARKLERERDEARERIKNNPWCEACSEPDCCVSGDGTCAMIRKYLLAKSVDAKLANDDQLDQTILRLSETQERMIDAERQRDRLAENLERALNATVLNHRNERWHIDAEHTLQLLQSLTPNEL